MSTGVLSSAEFIASNAQDVIVSEQGCRAAAKSVYHAMQEQQYSTETWASHPLHPKEKTESVVDWIFTIDLLNFSFWSDFDDHDTGHPSSQRFSVEYNQVLYTGYWSLVAAINKALDAGIPITSPSYWNSAEFTEDILRTVFESKTKEQVPLFDQRFMVLKEAGRVITDNFGASSFVKVVENAKGSAVELVNTVVLNFPSFNDESTYQGRNVKILKRAQILVSDLWACFNGKQWGSFNDVDSITMFADYRVPQILHMLDCISYSKELTSHVEKLQYLEQGSSQEVEIRGCSIWAVELIKKYILEEHPETKVNAILIDFYLWDSAKRIQQELGGNGHLIPCHRTRSIFY